MRCVQGLIAKLIQVLYGGESIVYKAEGKERVVRGHKVNYRKSNPIARVVGKEKDVKAAWKEACKGIEPLTRKLSSGRLIWVTHRRSIMRLASCDLS